MALSVLLTSGLFGFVAAILSGLALGLGWLECLGVYAGAGLAAAMTILLLRALWIITARRFA